MKLKISNHTSHDQKFRLLEFVTLSFFINNSTVTQDSRTSVRASRGTTAIGLYNFGNGSYESYESYERYESYEGLAKINFGNESYGDFILVE